MEPNALTGCFYGEWHDSWGGGSSGYTKSNLFIDASRQSSVYGSSNTVTPLSLTTHWFIKH